MNAAMDITGLKIEANIALEHEIANAIGHYGISNCKRNQMKETLLKFQNYLMKQE